MYVCIYVCKTIETVGAGNSLRTAPKRRGQLGKEKASAKVVLSDCTDSLFLPGLDFESWCASVCVCEYEYIASSSEACDRHHGPPQVQQAVANPRPPRRQVQEQCVHGRPSAHHSQQPRH